MNYALSRAISISLEDKCRREGGKSSGFDTHTNSVGEITGGMDAGRGGLVAAGGPAITTVTPFFDAAVLQASQDGGLAD